MTQANGSGTPWWWRLVGYAAEEQRASCAVYQTADRPPRRARIGEKPSAHPVFMAGRGWSNGDTTRERWLGLACGRHLGEARLTGVRFERCGTAVHGTYMQQMTGCSFADCGTALTGSTRFDLVLRECTFTGNKQNWSLLYKPLIAIDCEIDSWDRGTYSAETRHLRYLEAPWWWVRVVDEPGQAGKGARGAGLDRAVAAGAGA